MIAFAARRLLVAAPLLWGVLTIVFLIAEAVPGRAFDSLQEPGSSPEAAAHLRRLLGADRPLPERYLGWLAAFARGDLGVSLGHRRPVSDLLAVALANTARLASSAILLQFLLGTCAGLLAGVWAARGAGPPGRRPTSSPAGIADRIVTGGAALLYSIPSFWLGLVLVWILSVRAGWFPVSQMGAIDAPSLGPLGRSLDALHHLVLPCLALALPGAGGVALYVREEMRAALGRGFVRAAVARGVPPGPVVRHHAFRGICVPLANLFGLALPGVVGGSLVVEVLFAWPGMGRLMYQAVLARDEPLVLGCACVAALAVILGSLTADVVSAAVDPRVREAGR